MIKFRCGNCNQKLGVDDKYAGRRVRCNKCNEPARVPSPDGRPIVAIEKTASKPAPKPAPSPVQSSEIQLEGNTTASTDPQFPESEEANIFDGFDFNAEDEDAKRMEAIQIARQDRVARKTKAVKSSGKSSKEKILSESGVDQKKGFSMMAFADMIPPVLAFPLSLIACLLAMAAAIGISIVITRVTGPGLGISIMIVPIAGAFGLRLFMVNRTILLGMLGLIIGLGGMGVAKVAMAKYVIKGYYQKTSTEEILVNLDKILADAASDDEGQTASIRPIARNGTYQVCTALIFLVDEGEAEPIKTRGWIIDMLKSSAGATVYDQLLGNSDVPDLDFEEMEEQKQELISKAWGLAFEWEEEKLLLQKVKKYYPVLKKLMIQSEHQEILADPDRVSRFCLVQSFGVFDAIWILLGMGMTYIVLSFD